MRVRVCVSVHVLFIPLEQGCRKKVLIWSSERNSSRTSITTAPSIVNVANYRTDDTLQIAHNSSSFQIKSFPFADRGDAVEIYCCYFVAHRDVFCAPQHKGNRPRFWMWQFSAPIIATKWTRSREKKLHFRNLQKAAAGTSSEWCRSCRWLPHWPSSRVGGL